MKLKLLPKFILSLGALGVVLTITISFFSYINSKTYLEEMFAQNVMVGSKSIASMLSIEDVKAIISEDGDKTEAYERTVKLLNTLKEDGDITFLSLVVPDEDSVTFYIDTMVESMGDDPAQQISYGTDILYVDAAKDEADLENYHIIWEYYAKNQAIPKPLVTDNSYGYNYTAVSPVLDENGKAIAEIQYILDMQEVRSYLNSFLYTMLLISLGIIAVTLLIYILFVRCVVTNPIEKLAKFTQHITDSGEFKNHSIEIKTGDEIEGLGNSFNYMLEELERYVENLALVTAEKERIGAELGVAKHIQASMLPSIFPAFPEREEFEIYASMDPAKEVGGDFYDFFLVDDDHLAMVIADVSGKGVPAALFMVIAKTLIKNCTQTGATPEAVLERVNNQLCENNEAEMFVTVWLGILELSTGKLIAANAGHEYPALMKANGSFELIHDKHGFVLAGMEGSRYQEYELTMEPGDTLFVYTDGVAEATDVNEELYGTDRMLTALNRVKEKRPEEMLPLMKQDIDAFVGEMPQFDDITMLCMRLTSLPAGDSSREMKELTVPASLDYLEKVQAFIEGELEKQECPMKIVMQILVAVEEIFVNIAHYAYPNGDGNATIRFGMVGEPFQAKIQFQDSGIPFNPLAKIDADVTLSAEERGIGGLGILMVKRSMDDMSYEYRDGCNILTIKKHFLKEL